MVKTAPETAIETATKTIDDFIETFKYRLKNPFICAAAVFALLVYAKILRVVPSASYKSLLPLENTICVWGSVGSNPTKVSSGKSYVFKLNADGASGMVSGKSISASSQGKLSVLVPAATVEALYPGKRFSASRFSSNERLLFETGQRVKLWGKVKGDLFITEEAKPLPARAGILSRLSSVRALCRLSFKRLMYDWGRAGGFILALLSGSREYTEKTLSEVFRRAGLLHILALSGMHLSIFASFSGGIASRLLGRRFQRGISLLGIVFFAWFAGLSPSLFRALLFSLVLFCCKAVFCSCVDRLAVLSFVFLLHSSLAPQDIFSLSFILSYGCLAGILIFSPLFAFLLNKVFPKTPAQALASSAAAQTASFPLSLVFFGAAAPVGVISSAVISPLAEVFLKFSIVAIVISLVSPPCAVFFAQAVNLFYSVIKGLASFFASAPMLAM